MYTMLVTAAGTPVTYVAPPHTAFAATREDTETTTEAVLATPLPQKEPDPVTPASAQEEIVPEVPFYSQFADIHDPSWKKVGCGIASLAMLIDYYEPAVSVDELLREGIDAGAYLDSAGWTYAGLIGVAEDHGLTGESVVMTNEDVDDAYAVLADALADGPVMASVYYTFTPGNPIPHLVVLNGIKDNVVYYNDPAAKVGNGTISVEKFKAAWKKRFIAIRPAA
jgi:predicted double-glycine peptidase